MKVALISQYSAIGGGESNFFALAKHLSNSCEIVVFCPKGDLFRLCHNSGLKVVELKRFWNRHWYRFIPIPFPYFYFRKILGDFDLVHVYSVDCLPMVFGIKPPIIWTIHGYWEYPNGFRGSVINLFVRKVIAVSQDVYNISSFNSSKKILIHLGTDNQSGSLNSFKKHFDAGCISICCIGRFQKIKGQDLLLDAVYQLSQVNEIRIIIVFVGDLHGENSADIEFKSQILAKAAKYRNSNLEINFVGFQNDVRPFILRSDFVVIPSYYESFSMVTIEALSLGKPVIAPKIGGPLDIIKSDEIGLLFKPGDLASLKESILFMIRNFHSYDSLKCISCADEFSVSNQSKKILQLYMQALK